MPEQQIQKITVKKLTLLVWGIVIIVFVINIAFGIFFQQGSKANSNSSFTSSQKIASSITYSGVNGKDALTLLKEKDPVEQNASGLVVSINGRKADESSHQYWAFYVNGKLASVGPAAYQTKKGDKIEWKMEKY